MRSKFMKAIFALLLAAACPFIRADSLEEALAQGRSALARQEVASAWEFSGRALTLIPDSAAAHEFAGEVRFRQGDIGGAEREFKKAIELSPANARAFWGLGRVLQCASLRSTARNYFRRAHELDPSDPGIFLAWANTLSGKERAEALRAYLAMNDPTLDEDGRLALVLHLAGEESPARKRATFVGEYAPSEIGLSRVMLDINRIRAFAIPVKIDDAKPLRLVVDTGASGIVLNGKTASRLALTRLADSIFGGIGDERKHEAGYIAIAGRVKIGNVEFTDYPIEVSDRKAESDTDGLIGTNFFSDFLVTLDFGAHKLRLNPLPNHRPGEETLVDRRITPELIGFTPVFEFGHSLMISSHLNDSDRPALFLLDTGSSTSIVSKQLAAEVTKVRRDDRSSVRGLSGTR